jgi:hypothetical protein
MFGLRSDNVSVVDLEVPYHCISQKIVCIMETKYKTGCIVGTAQSGGSDERMNGKRRKLEAAQ